MPQTCASDQCKHTARVLCHCCEKNLCLEHLQQHTEMNSARLNPLADEINTLSARLIAWNYDGMTCDDRRKLDQWREESLALIDQFYERKCEELKERWSQRKNRLQNDVDQIRSKLSKLITEQEFRSEELETLKLNISDVQRKMIQFEEKSMEIHVQPLLINEKLISIEESQIYQLDLAKLSIPYRNIPCAEQSCPAMVANDRYLLVDQYPYLVLYDRDLKVMKQLLWSHGFIRNMSWSATHDTFILINNEREVFLLKDNCSLIERVQTIEEQSWWSCACSETSLFLTNTTMGTNIFQFNLFSSCQLTQQWKPPSSCKKHEYIDDISYNHGTLALVIKVPSNNTVHFDLRSSKTLDQLWSIPLDIHKNWFQQTIRCCALKYDEWLVVEGNTSHLFHILPNGQLKVVQKYKPSPINAVLFASNRLAIRTEQNLIFHQL